MLDRATSCLKVGARDSLKYAQHAKKAQVPPTASRRRLHTTFWAHGAGDIDTDVNLLGVGAGAAARADSSTRHDDTRSSRGIGSRRKKHVGKTNAVTSGTASSHNDAPFLDFLYPPQALAWLQRNNGQPWERRESRTTRRLPEGFVQASRGYSSKSRAQPAETKSQNGDAEALAEGEDVSSDRTADIDPAEEEHSADNADRVRMDPIQPNSATEGDDHPEMDFHSRKRARNRAIAENTLGIMQELDVKSSPDDDATEEVAEKDEPSDEWDAISPGDLPEQGLLNSDPTANPHEVLRTMMSRRRREHTVEDVSRAWSLYNSLPESAKTDPRLMHELLLWYSRIDLETAQAHSISLFWAMPLEARALEDYEAVLTAFLKRKTYDAVAGVHQEALRNISNGHQITKKLFEHAVNSNNWQLALAVKDDHDSAFEGGGPAEARQKALFWLNVTEIPDLIPKAEALMFKCRSFQRRNKKDLDKFTAFSARMSEEAFRQALSAPSHWSPSQAVEKDQTQAALARLLDSIHEWSPNAPRLLEEFLVTLLDLNRTEGRYKQVHNIASSLYWHYRQMPDIHPPKRLFEELLSRVLMYLTDLQKPRLTKQNVTIEVIVEDYQKHHKILSCEVVKRLMAYYSRQGMIAPLDEYYAYLQRHYPAYKDQESALWSLIYVHARRADAQQAQQAFDHVDSVAKMNRASLDTKCWNVMMHAHARADDLVGGLDTFGRMVDVEKLVPNYRAVHPLLEMLSRRGDIDGITDLLKQYDSMTNSPHSTSFLGAKMGALINSGDVPEAEQTLKDALPKTRKREIIGSLTTCFNILISAHARRRDIDAVMRTYRWMKAEKIRLDRYTYTGLMLALVHFRQTPAAYTIMTKVMRKEGLEATAIHYAIVMTGLVKQGLYDRAIWMQGRMERKNIRPSLATRRLYMQALGMRERKQGNAYTPDGAPAPLMQVVEELRNVLSESDGSEIASKDPTYGHDYTGGGGEDVHEHFASILFVHGKHRCFEAVHELFKLYQEEVARRGKADAAVPMRILTAMMYTHLQTQDYEQVEAYWNVAKDNAERIAPTTAVPDYQAAEPSTTPALADTAANPRQEALVGATGDEVDRAEIGFEANREAATSGESTLLPASLPRMAPRPSPGRTVILTRPLRYFIQALSQQNRIADVLTTFTALVRQGYTFDIITWNRFIESLCTASPPLALLAFTLTERYLIPNFPGWTPRYKNRRHPRKSAVEEGLQYIRGRYLSYDALVPQYRTMVQLTVAFLKLKRMEANGIVNTQGNIGRFVGTVRQIEAAAPRTVDAVNSLPQVEHDLLQNRYLSNN